MGSLLLDCANTIEEIEVKIATYKARKEDFDKTYPLSKASSQYVYISNRPEWWKI